MNTFQENIKKYSSEVLYTCRCSAKCGMVIRKFPNGRIGFTSLVVPEGEMIKTMEWLIGSWFINGSWSCTHEAVEKLEQSFPRRIKWVLS